MRDATQYILAKTSEQSLETYRRDRDLQHIVERNFEIIGEALGRLRRHDAAIAHRISHSREIVDLRNVLIHAYDDVDPLRVWHVIERELPVLNSELEDIMRIVARDLTGQDSQ